MKKQLMATMENLSNFQKSIDSLKSLFNTQESFLEKSIENLPSMETRFACGGGAAI